MLNVTKRIDIHRYKQLVQALQNEMKQLAAIASEQNLMILEKDFETFSPGQKLDKHKQPLGDVLLRKSERLSHPFHLAVVGEFSRGKSTLINALLGSQILASNHRPNTATETVIRYGTEQGFLVSYWNEAIQPLWVRTDNLLEDMAQYVSEADFSGSQDSSSDNHYKAVLQELEESIASTIKKVEVVCNSEFLGNKDVEIVDTPGLASVIDGHKNVTYRVIREVDAILFTVQVDPGIGHDEVAFVRMISEHVDKLFFVVTKIDQVRGGPQVVHERIMYWKNVIEIRAGIKVQHMYPVSAAQQLNGSTDDSGFNTLVPHLEDFLVRSGGYSRLLNPLNFAIVYCQDILRSASAKINNIDVSPEQLRKDLQALTELSTQVETVRSDLLAYVDLTITGMLDTALDGLDHLPTLIQRTVESALASLTAKQLRDADRYIQPAIKESVASWLTKKKQTFTSSIGLMNKTIKDDLTKAMENIDFDEKQLNLVRSIEFEVSASINTNSATKDIGDRIINLLTATGVTDVVATTLANFARRIENLGRKAVNFVGRLFGRRENLVQESEASLRLSIEQALVEPRFSGNRNIYEAIVFGYEQYGHDYPGVRSVVTETFMQWGHDLKVDVTKIIRNNLDSRQQELQMQIQQKSEKNESLAAYKAERDKLARISAKLLSIQDQVKQLLDQV